MTRKNTIMTERVFLKGKKPIFILTFSCDSHFGSYRLFSPFLVPKIKKSDLVFVPTVSALTAKS